MLVVQQSNAVFAVHEANVSIVNPRCDTATLQRCVALQGQHRGQYVKVTSCTGGKCSYMLPEHGLSFSSKREHFAACASETAPSPTHIG